MLSSKCKQVTNADVVSGWHFSGPLADQIRRKNGSPLVIAQSGEDVPLFGISTEPWVRLRWGQQWARKEVRGWSMAAIIKWFGFRQLQDQNPKDKWSVGTASWWTMHHP
tara:strand:+ start:5093 stop:5419 length:327 start_codon:yes stop_codon:yes gene_type:complete